MSWKWLYLKCRIYCLWWRYEAKNGEHKVILSEVILLSLDLQFRKSFSFNVELEPFFDAMQINRKKELQIDDMCGRKDTAQ